MTRQSILASIVAATLILRIAGLEAQSPEEWFRNGRAAVEKARQEKPIMGHARNVILFLGDGMGISTVTAARPPSWEYATGLPACPEQATSGRGATQAPAGKGTSEAARRRDGRCVDAAGVRHGHTRSVASGKDERKFETLRRVRPSHAE